MFKERENGVTRSGPTYLGLLWRNPKWFFPLISFKGVHNPFPYDQWVNDWGSEWPTSLLERLVTLIKILLDSFKFAKQPPNTSIPGCTIFSSSKTCDGIQALNTHCTVEGTHQQVSLRCSCWFPVIMLNPLRNVVQMCPNRLFICTKVFGTPEAKAMTNYKKSWK